MTKRTHISGIDEAMQNLRRRMDQIEGATMKGLLRGAIIIRRESMRLAPVDTGNLRASAYIIASWAGTTEGGGGFSGDQASEMRQNHSQVLGSREASVRSSQQPLVEVGYTAVYAARVHENPNAGAANPESGAEVGQWKYLEQAIKDNEQNVVNVIAQEAEDATRR